jgi:hypothetical protein
MDASLPLKCRPGTTAHNLHDRFADASHGCVDGRHDLALPALSFGVAQVGTKKFSGEDPRLVAARPWTHLYKEIATVVWIGLKEEPGEALKDFALNEFSGGAVSRGKSAHLCVRLGVPLKAARLGGSSASRFEPLPCFSEWGGARELAANSREDRMVGERLGEG